jgi:hypothetical protein
MPSQTSLLGAAGEYFVMAELLRRDYIAALAPQGVPNADIVVTDCDSQRLCSIQVKSRRAIGADGGWHMKQKHENIRADRLFYCFVNFRKAPSDRPIVHVMPSIVVAKVLSLSHRKWLANPGRNDKPHNDGQMRRMLPDYTKIFGSTDNPYPLGWLDQYLDAWELLRIEPANTKQDME